MCVIKSDRLKDWGVNKNQSHKKKKKHTHPTCHNGIPSHLN